VHGKERIEIEDIEPQGTDAVQLRFSDGHTGTYAWPDLHELGRNYEQHWQAYEQQLERHNLSRDAGRPAGPIHIRVLYFIKLAKIAGREGETLEIPERVNSVEALLAWLRERGPEWQEAFADDAVQVTVNKQFAEPFTLIEQGDEVAIVPRTR
jgi:molybdopterin synthase sulfur carrier subunit